MRNFTHVLGRLPSRGSMTAALGSAGEQVRMSPGPGWAGGMARWASSTPQDMGQAARAARGR